MVRTPFAGGNALSERQWIGASFVFTKWKSGKKLEKGVFQCLVATPKQKKSSISDILDEFMKVDKEQFFVFLKMCLFRFLFVDNIGSLYIEPIYIPLLLISYNNTCKWGD